MAACAAVTCVASIAAAAPADNGAVPQRGGPVSEKASAPPLNLTDSQRQQIGQAVAARHTDVSFAMKSAKAAQSFQPTVHAKLAKGLMPHPLPGTLFTAMPSLEHYDYVMFKGNVLIVNPMNREIVEIIHTSNG
jgi:hypothetical protein